MYTQNNKKPYKTLQYWCSRSAFWTKSVRETSFQQNLRLCGTERAMKYKYR